MVTFIYRSAVTNYWQSNNYKIRFNTLSQKKKKKEFVQVFLKSHVYTKSRVTLQSNVSRNAWAKSTSVTNSFLEADFSVNLM